ncbi:glycosyl transferase [Geomonas sp. Red276]
MARLAQRIPKVMHVVFSLAPGGGAERLVYELARDPVFSANPPVVCCLHCVGALGERLQEEGYRIFCRTRARGFDFSIVRWLARVMIDERIEVVHAHQYTPMFYAVPAAFLAAGRGVVYTEHGRLYPDVASWKRRMVNPLLALGLDRLVSISHCTKEAMVAVDNLPSRRIQVVHNGVRLSEPPSFDAAAKRRALGVGEGDRLIGTAARLEPIKNIAMMLRALKEVAAERPETVLLIAGFGSQEQVLRDLARELGVEDRVRFLGLRDDLLEIYPLLELFLLTSFSEGISITLLEAMSQGVPAVATRAGGNSEVVVEGETGYLVEVDDDRALAAAILRLLAAPELGREMGFKAARRVEGSFSFDAMVQEYLDIYRAVVGRR